MANLSTVNVAENEIIKAEDVTFGYDGAIDNVALALNTVLSNSSGNFVLGGKVRPSVLGGMNVTIEPIYAYCGSTGVCVVETTTTESVSLEEADRIQNRIDIIQVRGIPETYDRRNRMFIDSANNTRVTRPFDTKKRIKLDVVVKKGSLGYVSAPNADKGYVKVAEVKIGAGVTQITADMITNISARKNGAENIGWTNDKTASFSLSHIADMLSNFLKQHNEDGTHRAAVIDSRNIDFGTSGAKVRGTLIPTGESLNVNGTNYNADTRVTALIKILATNINSMGQAISTLSSQKVDKVSGKGLSTNDYTTSEKNKLAGIAIGANKYAHPTYSAKTGLPTANLTPAFGDTITISQPISDGTGHITAMNARTIKIPNSLATTSAAGLMSAADKEGINRFGFIKYPHPPLSVKANVIVIVISDNGGFFVADEDIRCKNKIISAGTSISGATGEVLVMSSYKTDGFTLRTINNGRIDFFYILT